MPEQKTEIYKRFRPKTLKGLVGQDAAINSLTKLVEGNKIPHALLFTGPSGCGKTTIARILRESLNCGDGDFIEMNCADTKGIDTIREISRHSNLRPMHGDTRIWLLDEAGKMTGEAQNAFLKLLEDAPRHCYFMLATTDPQKLIKTIHTRCTQIKLSPLGIPDLRKVIQRVVDKEQMTVTEPVVQEIAEAADGSARKALVILEQVADLEGDEAQILAIQTTTFNKDEAIHLARELVFPEKGWLHVCSILRNLKDEDAEGIRYCVLGYARAILVGSEGKPSNPKWAPRAFKVIDVFSDNFYDSKHAGLAAACYGVIHFK